MHVIYSAPHGAAYNQLAGELQGGTQCASILLNINIVFLSER